MSGYDVTISRQPLRAVFDLKGPLSEVSAWGGVTLADRPNRQWTDKGATICHLGPHHWLLLADLAEETRLEQALRPAEAPPEISIVKISDTLAFFRITGPAADQILATGCPLDLHPTVFAEDAASWSEMFGLRALVMRCTGGFEVAVEQSFGPMMTEYLGRAAG